MKEEKPAFVDYDYKNDILYVFSGEKAKESLEADGFVIDFSHGDKIVGVEVFDASKVLGLSKRVLKDDIKDAGLSINLSKDFVVATIQITIGRGARPPKEMRIPISLPREALA